MNTWQRATTPEHIDTVGDPGLLEFTPATSTRRTPASSGPSCVTRAGADWLASASIFPASVHALWQHRPASPGVLPCGRAFDVVSAAPMTGRRILDRLWSTGPGSGPVAVHRGRMLLFATPGTAQRLSALLGWGEWQDRWGRDVVTRSGASAETFPSLLCHGLGDSVTIPALTPAGPAGSSRWLVAPDLRHPWLPGPDVLLRACLRSRHDRRAPRPQPPVRAGRGPATAEQPIFETADRDAKVYDVTRRR
ncbi:MAG TPA: bifunctional DNA primase/polymerase [Streptomyces sp.]|jgi:hypothetical protein|nr:bifunctional DNA primase/polymerase [Streptomyces sp.]